MRDGRKPCHRVEYLLFLRAEDINALHRTEPETLDVPRVDIARNATSEGIRFATTDDSIGDVTFYLRRRLFRTQEMQG